jgi:hypothetical protein
MWLVVWQVKRTGFSEKLVKIGLLAGLALALLGAYSYRLYQARQAGKQECIQEVVIKELSHVVTVKEKQLRAVVNRPRDLDGVIDRLQHGTF